MAQFLRDEMLSNVTLTEARLEQLHAVFEARHNSMPEQAASAEGQPPQAFLSFIIRFDNKGYRVFSLSDLLAYFRRADYVERIIFTSESATSLRTNRNVGSYMELRLDNRDLNASILHVASDHADWVDASFSAVKEVLGKSKNRSGWVRGAWSQLMIQLAGVFVGFLASLWAAVKMSPLIPIDNAFFITFLFVLLIFSNLWGFLNQRLLAFVNATFPSVRFYRPDRDRLHWLMQAVIGGVVGAIALFLLNSLLEYLGRLLGELFSGNA